LPGVAVPPLAVTGGADPVTAPGVGRGLAAAIPDARFLLVERAGHLSSLERPEVVNEALLDFLEYVGKAPLVAYHAFFDQGMIDNASKSYLGCRPEFIWHDLAWLLPELFAERITGIVGLDTWQEQFKIDNYRRHNAVSDCLATAQLLQIAMSRASEIGLDSSRQLTLAEKARRSLRRS